MVGLKTHPAHRPIADPNDAEHDQMAAHAQVSKG